MTKGKPCLSMVNNAVGFTVQKLGSLMANATAVDVVEASRSQDVEASCMAELVLHIRVTIVVRQEIIQTIQIYTHRESSITAVEYKHR